MNGDLSAGCWTRETQDEARSELRLGAKRQGIIGPLFTIVIKNNI